MGALIVHCGCGSCVPVEESATVVITRAEMRAHVEMTPMGPVARQGETIFLCDECAVALSLALKTQKRDIIRGGKVNRS